MPVRRFMDGFASRVALALMLVVTLVIGTFVLVNVLVAQKLGSAKRVDLTLAGTPSGGGGNYLLVGSDTRAFVATSGVPLDSQRFGGNTGGQRSDTIMVLHVDPNSSRALLVSFPRDLWVNIPGTGDAKINAAFNAGPQALIDTLSTDFNVPIQHYVEVNFDSFRQIVDAIGTVPVYFPAPARDALSGLSIPTAGCQNLDGPTGLAFVRSRHLELFDATTGRWRTADPIPDLGRIARQQAFLRVLGKEAMNAAITNPFTANDIADSAVGQLSIDSAFGRGDLFDLVDAFAPGKANAGPLTLTVPTTSATRGGQSVLLPTSAADSVVNQLRNFNTVVPPAQGPAASPSDTSVRVLNASGTQGSAARALAALKARGFVGVGTGNAGDVKGATEVRYPAGNESKATLVASMVTGPVTKIADSNVRGADITLVLGRSFRGIAAAAATPTPTGPGFAPQPAALAPVPGGC